ncbi:hypothetical protein [Streptomyces liangshanensis]|uniref:hypothetical protein n=1 Tax=Streptomyces liangshanensis TaxID=2717324 RepID=UPI0036D7A4E3
MFRITARSARRSAAAAAGVAATVGLVLSATLPASAAPATDPNNRYTAAEIRTFLQDFYGEQGPGPFARTYGISPRLAQRVKDTDGYDLLLCAQNTPQSIDIGPATTAQSLGRGWATVTTHWGGSGENTSSFKAYVDLDATRTIQLLDVDCEPDA